MSDHLVLLPSHFSPVQAVEPGHSKSRHIAASLANIQQILLPNSCAHFQALVSDIYAHYTGQPDIPANTLGMTRDQALDYLSALKLAVIDMTPQLNDIHSFKQELQCVTISGLPVFLMLADEAQLKLGQPDGSEGAPLHNWLTTSPGAATSLIRVGYSDSVANAYYYDSLLSPAFDQPVAIPWQSVQDSTILCCLAVLPASITVAPPTDFRYFAGVDANGAMLPPNVWPVPAPPAPTLDVASATVSAQAFLAASQQLASVAAGMKVSAESLLKVLGSSDSSVKG